MKISFVASTPFMINLGCFYRYPQVWQGKRKGFWCIEFSNVLKPYYKGGKFGLPPLCHGKRWDAAWKIHSF